MNNNNNNIDFQKCTRTKTKVCSATKIDVMCDYLMSSLLNGGKVYCNHLLPGSILLAGGGRRGASMGYMSDLGIILCTPTEPACKRENNQIVTPTHTHKRNGDKQGICCSYFSLLVKTCTNNRLVCQFISPANKNHIIIL